MVREGIIKRDEGEMGFFIIMEIETIQIVKPKGSFDMLVQIIAMNLLIWVNKRERRRTMTKRKVFLKKTGDLKVI